MATSPKDTSLSSAFRYAIDQPLENMATTFQALGMEGWEKFMRDIVEEPENYEAAAGEFINAQGEGFNWEYFPRAVFEQAGQIAGSLLARGGGAGLGLAAGGPGGALAGALIGPALFEAIQIAGPVAMERARNNDREEPNWDDWKGALGTSAFSGALNAVGIRNVGVLNNIGKGALKQAGKQVVKGGVSEGVTEGFQGAAEQIGGSALTEAGLQFDPKAAVGEGLLGAGAGTGTQVGTEVLGQVAPPTQDGTLYSNPFTRLFGKKEEAEEAPEPTAVPEETPPQTEDQRPADEILMEQLYGEIETEAQKIPTLRKYLDPVTLRGSLISGSQTEAAKAWDEDVINTAYEGLAQEIEKEFEATNVPKENRGPILQDVLGTIKTPGGQDQYVTSDLIWEDGILPENLFRTQDILFGLVKPKIAELSAEAEPAVEETNLLEINEHTRGLFNQPNFTAFEPENLGRGKGRVQKVINEDNRNDEYGGQDVPIGRVNRLLLDPSIGLMEGEQNAKGFFPDKIDPGTMGYSVLRKHLTELKKGGTSKHAVPGLGKKPTNPMKLFASLFLKQNILGFPAIKENLKPKQKKIAEQAISTGMAQRLLDLKQQGKQVFVSEIEPLIDNHYSRFNTQLIMDQNWSNFEQQAEAGRLKETSADNKAIASEYLQDKKREVLYEEIMRSPLFSGLEERVQEDIIDQIEGPRYGQAPELGAGVTFDPGVSPQWLTEQQYAEIENEILPKYEARMAEEEQGLPSMLPLMAPKNSAYGAWENIRETMHRGEQHQDFLTGKYGKNGTMKDVFFKDYYLEPTTSDYHGGTDPDNMTRALSGEETQKATNVEMWMTYNPQLSAKNELETGLDVGLRRADPRHYSQMGGGHSLLPGTYGWTRGPLLAGPRGIKLFMFAEIQQDLYRQGDPKMKKPGYKGYRFRSQVGEAKLTPSEKVSQQKLDNIDNALGNVFGRGGSVYESALFAPFMTLEKDTGAKGEFSAPDEYALDPDRYPRYIIKDLPARRNGFLRRIPGVGDARRLLGTTDFRLGQERFYTGLPDQGMNIIPGGDAVSTPLLENITDQINSDKIDGRLRRTRNRIYGDWLLEAQPFLVLGRVLSEQDIATHLENDNWLQFFGDAMGDPDIQSKVAAVERVMPFINHLVYQENAPFILKEARPWAMEEIRSEMNSENFDVEIAPVIDALMNPDENLTDEKIKKLEKKEETGEIAPESIVPDYPLQGFKLGQEAYYAKDVLQRGIVKLLQTFPDLTHVGLQRHSLGTGAPSSPYASALEEAKKLAAENDFIDIEQIAKWDTGTKDRKGNPIVQEFWILDISRIPKELIAQGAWESMMKGGLVKKATNQVLNYGDYGRRFI